MSSEFMTEIKGSLIKVYRSSDLKTPIAEINSADDEEDLSEQIWEAVQAAYNAGRNDGYREAKSEPLKDDPRVRKVLERLYNEGRRKGREQHAAQLRALLNEGLKKGKKNEKTSHCSDL